MRNDNSMLALKYLRSQDPSDEIILDKDGFLTLEKMRNEIVGEDINLVADIIWSQTVPLTDFIVELRGKKLRFCFFEDAIENLHLCDKNNKMLVGAVQELNHNSYFLIGVIHGNLGVTYSDEFYDEEGNGYESIFPEEYIQGLCRLWHAIQLTLLHPKSKEMLPTPKIVKEHEKKKDINGKRKRRTYYIKRYVVDGEKVSKAMREINRKCKAWYVIGHWRNLPNGKTTYVRGHWKGELRALKRNLDDGRERKVN